MQYSRDEGFRLQLSNTECEQISKRFRFEIIRAKTSDLWESIAAIKLIGCVQQADYRKGFVEIQHI